MFCGTLIVPEMEAFEVRQIWLYSCSLRTAGIIRNGQRNAKEGKKYITEETDDGHSHGHNRNGLDDRQRERL